MMERDETPRIDVLAREVRAARNGLLSAIDTRLRHPAYGVSKEDIRKKYEFLKGIAAGYAIMCGHDSAMGEFLARAGINLVTDYEDSTYEAIQHRVAMVRAQGRGKK